MSQRSRANEIPDLVRRLGSRRASVVDAARARLAVIGGRAVEALIEALEGDNNRVRACAMPLLALIGDARGREPLVAMLLDRDARMREVAAGCLGRFPSNDAVAALDRLLETEAAEDVRVAAVQALVEQYAAGEEQALRGVLELLYDKDEASATRTAGLALLPLLRAAQRRSLARSLARDPDRHVAARTREILRGLEGAGTRTRKTIKRYVADLASDDYAVWNEAVRRLAACGTAAIDPLLAEMQSRSHDPEFCKRAGMALKALGPRRVRALADALDRLEEPLPLQVLVDVIGALGERSMIYRLKGLIERVGAMPPAVAEVNGFDMMQRVRAKAHLELARIGSRVAIEDLHDALSGRRGRCELEMLAAVERIGTRDEIGDLLLAYRREDRFMRERIAEVVRSILRRERIRRNNPMFQRLGPEQRRAFDSIVPPARTGSRPPGRRRARPRPLR